MENFYTTVMRRLVGDVLTIRKVLGLGGKRAVRERFSERAGHSRSHREFYLVDGDFDDLLVRILPTAFTSTGCADMT